MPMLHHIDVVSRRQAGRGEGVRTRSLCRARMQPLWLPFVGWVVQRRALGRLLVRTDDVT